MIPRFLERNILTKITQEKEDLRSFGFLVMTFRIRERPLVVHWYTATVEDLMRIDHWSVPSHLEVVNWTVQLKQTADDDREAVCSIYIGDSCADCTIQNGWTSYSIERTDTAFHRCEDACVRSGDAYVWTLSSKGHRRTDVDLQNNQATGIARCDVES